MPRLRATTILAVRTPAGAAIGGDGQVTLGSIVMKTDAKKIRRLYDGKVLAGFAGAAADAFSLLERFEAKLRDHQGSVPRAATELAKEWRTDRVLRRLEAMLVVLDRDNLLLLSGTGDVIQPSDNVVAIGSGGPYALAAARALMAHTAMKPARGRPRRPGDRRGDLHLHQPQHRGAGVGHGVSTSHPAGSANPL